MTRKLLYEEISVNNPNIYSYSQFNRCYNKFVQTVNPSMRQIHYGGDKLFIDYSGLTMPIVNQRTGEITNFRKSLRLTIVLSCKMISLFSCLTDSMFPLLFN